MRNPFALNIDYQNRVYGLDIVRAYAIMQVVLIHGNLILDKVDTKFPWVRLIEGVEVFFVLSGFLIGTILISTFEKKGVGFSIITEFLKRRWFRTLPNYYLVLLINVVLVCTGLIDAETKYISIKYFLFIQNFFTPLFGFFWESWSITIEEWFYLLFPATIVTGFLVLKRGSVKQFILLATILFMTIPFLLRCINLHHEDLWIGLRSKGIVIYKLDAIAFGILGAWIKYYYRQYWYRYKNILFFAAFVLLYVYMYVDKSNYQTLCRVFNNSLNSLFILMFFPFMDSIKQGKGRFSKAVTHISVISYSMYLLNLAVICQVITSHFMRRSLLSSFAFYFLYWVLVIALSTLLYKYYEKPMTNLREKAKV